MEYCEGGSMEDIYKRAKAMEAVIGETILAKMAEAVSQGCMCALSHKPFFY
jgi:mitogen-activated protein kinase kinase